MGWDWTVIPIKIMKTGLFLIALILSVNTLAQKSETRFNNKVIKDKFRDLQLVGDTCYGFWLTAHINPKSDPDSLYPAFISKPGKRFYVSYTLKQIPEHELLFDSTWYWPFFRRNEPREYREGDVMYYSEKVTYQPSHSDREIEVLEEVYRYFDFKLGLWYHKKYCNGEVCEDIIINFRKAKQGKPYSEQLEYMWHAPEWTHSQ